MAASCSRCIVTVFKDRKIKNTQSHPPFPFKRPSGGASLCVTPGTYDDPMASELTSLRNIGPAMARDLAMLGVDSIQELANKDADLLYLELGSIAGTRPDPCVHDTFAAAIHQARTGEALPWCEFTPGRKERQRQGTFV